MVTAQKGYNSRIMGAEELHTAMTYTDVEEWHEEKREGRVEKGYASQQTDGEKNMEVKDTLEINER